MFRIFFVFSVFLARFLDGLGIEAFGNGRKESIFLNNHLAVPGAPRRLTLLNFDEGKESDTFEKVIEKDAKVLHRIRRSINPDRSPEAVEV